VSWRVTPDGRGERLLTVVVDQAPPSPHADLLGKAASPDPALRATLYHPRWPLPLVVCDLSANPGRQAWLGSQQVPVNVAAQMAQWPGDEAVLDVHSPARHLRPPVGAAARVAEARRWAARGVVAARLATVSAAGARSVLTRNAQGSFTRAARLYASAPGYQAQSLTCAALGDPEPTPARPDWRSSADRSAVEIGDPYPAMVTAAEAWYAAALTERS
jgi:hypothetical protein